MEVQEGLCSNISIGGMMVHSDNPRPQGSLVRFELVIDDDVTIRGLGEVIWMRTQSSGSQQERGMGVKFRFLEQRDRQLIFKLVSQHIKERLAQKHPGDESEGEAAEAPPARPTIREAPAESFETSFLEQPALHFEPEIPPSDPAPEPGGIFGVPRDPDISRDFEDDDPPFASGRFDDDEAFDPPRLDKPVEEIYRPRAARRREFPVLPTVALLVLAGTVLLYLYWNEIFGAPQPPPAVAETAVNQPAVNQPDVNQPDESKVNVREIEPDNTAPEPGTQPAASATKAAPPPVARPSPPPPPSPSPPPPPPSPPPPAVAAFGEVVDISWTRQPGGLKVTIETDGAVPSSRYRHFRLDGETPREVLRLNGVKRRFPKSEIPISGAAVNRIRVGYHDNQELHIVLDMRDRTSKVVRVRAEGRRIELLIE